MPEIISASTCRPRQGKATELLTLLSELQQEIRAEPGNLDDSISQALVPGSDALVVMQTFTSKDAFTAHSAHMAGIDASARVAALISDPLPRPELFERRRGPVAHGDG